MPQGGKKGGKRPVSRKRKTKGGADAGEVCNKKRKRAARLRVGNPVRTVKKSGKFAMKGRKIRKVSGKIHNNIEALMAAKVLNASGKLSLRDLKSRGKQTAIDLDRIRAEKEAKRRKKHAKPEKVNVPRI